MGESEREGEREGEREREGVRESESACDGEDDETGEASRKRSFTVESKTFELALDERKGKCQFLIVEKKRGVSTWIRLGLASLGLFKEGLIHCVKREREENLDSHSLCLLTIEKIYIYKARSPNYYTCDLY